MKEEFLNHENSHVMIDNKVNDNIPEGATHYTPHSTLYGRVNKKGLVEVSRLKGDNWEEIPLKLNETVLKPL